MKGVMGPVLITGVVVAIGNGWILAAWTAIYNWTHTGGTAPNWNPTGAGQTVKPIIGGGNVSGLGKNPNNAIPPDLIPGNIQTNPSYS